MKRTVTTLAICFILLLSIAVSAFAQTLVKISWDGQTIDSLDGVSAYYRRGSQDDANAYYSCAAFASRYFSSVYGVTLSNLLPNKTPKVSKGSLSVVTTPRKGDLVFRPSPVHSAIVKAVNGNSVILIEQNWKWYNKAWYTYRERVISKYDSSYKFYRWSNSSTTTPTTPTTPTNSSVTFCGDRDGKGWTVTKSVGYNAPNSGSLGFGDNQLSSIRIPSISGGQIKVVVYENENYSGRSQTFTGEGLYNLEPFGLDNVCSSYKIYK